MFHKCHRDRLLTVIVGRHYQKLHPNAKIFPREYGKGYFCRSSRRLTQLRSGKYAPLAMDSTVLPYATAQKACCPTQALQAAYTDVAAPYDAPSKAQILKMTAYYARFQLALGIGISF